MIKFFRHIRKSLLMENKTAKYFKYAIGEIILVVIGILIALQLNNANEERKLKEKESHALTEIVSDLSHNVSELNKLVGNDTIALGRVGQQMKSIFIVIEDLRSKKIEYNDSLQIDYLSLFAYNEAKIKTSGYESLVSIGLDLISDNKIRTKIGEYNTSDIQSFKGFYKEVRDDYYHYMLDYSRKEFARFGKVFKPVDYTSLKKNREFLESLRIFYITLNWYSESAKKTKEEASKLKRLIEEYLKKSS